MIVRMIVVGLRIVHVAGTSHFHVSASASGVPNASPFRLASSRRSTAIPGLSVDVSTPRFPSPGALFVPASNSPVVSRETPVADAGPEARRRKGAARTANVRRTARKRRRADSSPRNGILRLAPGLKEQGGASRTLRFLTSRPSLSPPRTSKN
ncbi:MAG: hypothetical protein A3K68_04300 [Euryarchaeota archaeon RBG_16_68_13]|nr:MAG: hypothetical protein A3K68_04300 [Euryarchaeota archaeon RBG_16_68_13]